MFHFSFLLNLHKMKICKNCTCLKKFNGLHFLPRVKIVISNDQVHYLQQIWYFFGEKYLNCRPEIKNDFEGNIEWLQNSFSV